jgi:hypothetical protein
MGVTQGPDNSLELKRLAAASGRRHNPEVDLANIFEDIIMQILTIPEVDSILIVDIVRILTFTISLLHFKPLSAQR